MYPSMSLLQSLILLPRAIVSYRSAAVTPMQRSCSGSRLVAAPLPLSSTAPIVLIGVVPQQHLCCHASNPLTSRCRGFVTSEDRAVVVVMPRGSLVSDSDSPRVWSSVASVGLPCCVTTALPHGVTAALECGVIPALPRCITTALTSCVTTALPCCVIAAPPRCITTAQRCIATAFLRCGLAAAAPRSQSFTAATPLRRSLVVVVLRRNPPVVRQRRFDAATLRSVLCDLVAVAPRPQS